MNDTANGGPDHIHLFDIASEQMGYFTAAQARCCGFTPSLLRHHATRGWFIRMRRGLYRLRDYPSSPREDVMASWLAVGKEIAVVSHESALDLLGLSDIIPDAVHLTVPRAMRYRQGLPGVTLHTTTKPLQPHDIVTRYGLRVTAPARTIADVAETGTAPDQVEVAVAESIERGLTTPRQLCQVAGERSQRVRELVQYSLDQVRL